MSILDSITDRLEHRTSEGPSRYRCPECGREFEVDASPKTAACGECLNDDVELIEA